MFSLPPDRWNQLDLAIVLLSIVGIILEELKMNSVLPINPTIIRIMRVLRIARGTARVCSVSSHHTTLLHGRGMLRVVVSKVMDSVYPDHEKIYGEGKKIVKVSVCVFFLLYTDWIACLSA